MRESPKEVREFIKESNRIEGIHRAPTKAEIDEYHRFMALEVVTVEELRKFVYVYQPNALFRDVAGLDVRIGNHRPMPGSEAVREELQDILGVANRNQGDKHIAHQVHRKYETLHPFTDGNGRSGRMLWKWMMRQAPLGFLHTWYYQSLSSPAME